MFTALGTRGRPFALGVALALGFAGSGTAAEVSYDFVTAAYVFGKNTQGGSSFDEEFKLVSSNLPISLDTGALSYTVSVLADPRGQASGDWSWGVGADVLHGTFATSTTVEVDFRDTPFTRYTGVRTVTGGEGYFANATGTGTYELFAIYGNTGVQDYFPYQGIEVARMSVTVDANAPVPQTDFRGVSVVVNNGVENASTNLGSNFGYYTTGSPSLLPLPETSESSYTFANVNDPPAFIGTFLDTSPGGTVSGTSSANDVFEEDHLGYMFTYLPGQAVSTAATGQFAGLQFVNDFESFSVDTGTTTLGETYSAVVVNRVALVPEPDTYALMLAGLGLLGAAARRRAC